MVVFACNINNVPIVESKIRDAYTLNEVKKRVWRDKNSQN